MSENKTQVTTPAEREIRTERIFDAPRERVFDAMTNAELIPKWWGPRKFETVVDKLEPHRGGVLEVRSRDGRRGDRLSRHLP